MLDFKEIKDYLNHLKIEKRASNHTLKNYQRDLDAFSQFLKNEAIEQWSSIDSHFIRRFISTQHRQQNLSGSSLQRRLSAIRGLFNFLIREQQLDYNPTMGIRAPKSANGR